MDTGFVYALVEREFTKTKEPVVKVGMSRKSNPADRLRGYPRGSFYIWVRHTPTPTKDERLILSTMKIWFKQRTDLGAEYFEGDQNVVTGLLSALMQARESMRSQEDLDEEPDVVVVSTEKPPTPTPAPPQPAVDSISVFDEFAKEHAADRLNKSSTPCSKLHAMFADYWKERHPTSTMRVGASWIERQCKSRLGATIRVRINPETNRPDPMIVFPPLVFDKNTAAPKPNPLFQRYVYSSM